MKITIDCGYEDKLDELLGLVRNLTRLEAREVARITDINTLLTQIDAATNDVAARIDALTATISGGVSAADADTVVAALSAEADKLRGLASDPNNPIPPA